MNEPNNDVILKLN